MDKCTSGTNIPNKVGVAFATTRKETEHGDAHVMKGQAKYTGPACTSCGRDNHWVESCYAVKHSNGTVLHVEGEMMLTQGDVAMGEVSTCRAIVFATVGNDIHEILMYNDA